MSIVRRSISLLVLVTALVLTLTGPAFAHVTLRADNTEAGRYAKYTVRVPNESDTASTTQIEVQMPQGYQDALVQPKPGWTLQMTGGVLTISGGAIAPGQFDEFSFSARNPEQAGDVAFPAIQTYDDGMVQNWVGPQDAEAPAPIVTITGEAAAEGGQAAGQEHAGQEQEHAATQAPAGEPATAPAAASGGNAMPVAWAGLVAGLLGLGLGGAAFARKRGT